MQIFGKLKQQSSRSSGSEGGGSRGLLRAYTSRYQQKSVPPIWAAARKGFIMKKRMIKKILSLTLVFAMVLPMSIPVFAAAAPEPEMEPYANNRYFFRHIPGSEHLLTSYEKTSESVEDEKVFLGWVDECADFIAGEVKIPAATVVTHLLAYGYTWRAGIMGVGKMGKVEIYTRTDKKYLVDSLTGKETFAGYEYYMVYKFYEGTNGKYGKPVTQEYIRHDK